MKKLFGIFTKQAEEQPKQLIAVSGISENEWRCLLDALKAEYEAAHVRQKDYNSEPNMYMKGIRKAIELVCATKPHTIAEVEVK